MTQEQQFSISRRKVLVGLGAIGIASAGAGLGTTAYFSDREDFTDNELVAGEFDLKVDWQQYYYGATETLEPVNAYPDMGINGGTAEDGIQDPILTREEIAQEKYELSLEELDEAQRADVEALMRAQFADMPDDAGPAVIDLDDVKPGDWGKICFSLHLFDNPGYIWLYAKNLVSEENGINEPESKDPDEVDGEVSGELEESIIVNIYYDEDEDCEFNAGDSSVDHKIFGPGFGGYTDETGDNPATLAAAFEVMARNDGLIPLDGDVSSPMAFGDGNDAETRDPFVNSTTKYVVMEWMLPVDHANEIQSDSVTFDMGFYAEQARHNTGADPMFESSVNEVPTPEDA